MGEEAHVARLEGGLHLRPGRVAVGDPGPSERAERCADVFGMDVDRVGAERGEALPAVAGRKAAPRPQAGVAQQEHDRLGEDAVLGEGLGADRDRGRRAAGESEGDQDRGETAHHAGPGAAACSPGRSTRSTRRKPTICSTGIAEKGIAPVEGIARATSSEPENSVAPVINSTSTPQTGSRRRAGPDPRAW